MCTRSSWTTLIPAALFGVALAASAADPDPVERFIVDAGAKLQVEPEYPPTALAAGTDGEVTVEFDVDIFGGVRQPKVVASAPPGVFDSEALATIAYWKFFPAREPSECRRLEQRARQTFRFHAALPESQRVEVLPTVVEGLPSPDRPIVHARTLEEIKAAIAKIYPERPLPQVDIVPLKRTEPQWPRTALVNGISGFVTVKLTITEIGETKDITIAESLPKGMFDASVLRALKSWRFAPPMKDGKAVSWGACQTIDFRMMN